MGERSNTNELISHWVEKAAHDLGIAETLRRENSPYFDGICFHCQQASENMLKACLVHFELEFKKSHNLSYLADLLEGKAELSGHFYDMLESLDGYAVEVRYPDVDAEPTRDEAYGAIDSAREIMEVLKALLP